MTVNVFFYYLFKKVKIFYFFYIRANVCTSPNSAQGAADFRLNSHWHASDITLSAVHFILQIAFWVRPSDLPLLSWSVERWFRTIYCTWPVDGSTTSDGGTKWFFSPFLALKWTQRYTKNRRYFCLQTQTKAGKERLQALTAQTRKYNCFSD